MSQLPAAVGVPVIRAAFSNNTFWARLREDLAEETKAGFAAHVEFVEDRSLVASTCGRWCAPRRRRLPGLQLTTLVTHFAA